MRLKKQKGFALITLIIAMVLMAALGAGIYTVTTSSTFSELLASRDYNAYQLAKAGARYAASLLADNPNLEGTFTYYMPDANHSFTITVTPDPNIPGRKNITSKGNVNPNTFLAAIRQLAFNLFIPAAWGGPSIPFTDPNWNQIESPGQPDLIKLTPHPDPVTGITNPADNTADMGAGTYHPNPGDPGTAPNSYGSLWYQGTNTNGSCNGGSCSFGFGLRAFFEFKFLLPDTRNDSTDYADGFTFAVMSALKNTKDRTGGMGTTSEGELLGYAGPGNTVGMAQYPGEGLVPPKMALEFDTYPNQGTSPTYEWCAAEGGTCTFSGTKTVRYGARVSGRDYYFYKSNLTSPVVCDNTTITSDGTPFGDPIIGTVKACYTLETANICSADSRYDYSNKNHAALIFWGAKTAAGTSCTGSPNSYDDNMHGAGAGTSGGDPMNSIPGVSGVSTGYHEDAAVNWMEDANQYSVRMEIVRPTPDTATTGTYNYQITAWIVRSDTLSGLTQSEFQDVTVPLPTGIATITVSRTVSLSAQDHSDLSKIFFGFTESSGMAKQGGQKITLANLKVFFPQQEEATSPCSYTLTPAASPTHPAAGGSGSFAVTTSSTCFWEASSLANWITITGGQYGQGNGTVNYTVAENTSFSSRPPGNISVAGQAFTVTQAGKTCSTGQFLAEYFANVNLTAPPALMRCDATPLNFNWGTGSPDPSIPADNFSARWTGQFPFSAGVYTFIATADDGVRVRVDGDLVINGWVDQGPTPYTAYKTLTEGSHTVVMEYYERGGGAVAQLGWAFCPAISIDTESPLPDGTKGTAYSQPLAASVSNGAPPTYTWALDSGALPTGLTLSSAGLISGTPTSTGTSTFTVRATGNCSTGQTITKAFTLTIGCPAITITTASLPNGTGGVAYPTTTLTASAANDAATTYTWTIDSGALPTGLTLSAGVISGTPTGLGGDFTVTVKATGNCSTGQTATKAFTFTIGCPTISITTSSLPNGTAGAAYSQQLAASGATTYTWAIDSGALPTGLTLSSAGLISGTPTGAGGSFPVTVRATGNCSAGQIATKAFTLVIGCPAISITTASPLTAGTVGTAYSQTLAATPANSAPFTWSVVSGSLPAGLTLSSAGVISGTPTTAVTSAAFTVQATGNCSTGQTITKAFTLTVNKGTATVTLSNMTQTYTGSPLTPTATTSPAGLTIVWTNAPQTNVGTYAVTATISDANYQGSASGSFVIGKATATVTLSNLTQTYTGSSLTPTATTNPAGLPIVWTGAPQTYVGTYPVTATINNANYQGSASGSFVINQATATVTLGNMTQTYTGSPLTPTATTSPAGLTIVWTGAPQTNVGTYPVTATINNANYQGSASGSFVINKATATVTLGSMTQTYTGSALTPTATTNPAGLTIVWTGAPQTNVGTYPVTATVNNANYQGSASGSFMINMSNQTITVSTHAPASAPYNSAFTVAATASSGLPVAYSSGNTSICTNNGATFTMNAVTGTCPVRYDQAGNTNYNAAPRVTENTAVPTCSGGTVTSSGGDTIHTFTSSGTLQCFAAVSADVLIVAGGGGGGGGRAGIAYGGGGGGGGLLQGTLSLTARSYTVTVGAGGAGVLPAIRGISGGNSVFSGTTTYTANGGGGGGADNSSGVNENGQNGGSGGGGGGQYSGTRGSANQGSTSPLTGYGFNGAAGTATYLSGGGGGAGGAASGGTGGPGRASSISGTSITYAEGGDYSGGSGTAGTGNGGGGTAAAAGTYGSAGGSGVVIIRY
jgi:hypothetical protein